MSIQQQLQRYRQTVLQNNNNNNNNHREQQQQLSDQKMSTTTTHAPLSAAAKAAEQRAFELEKAAVTSYEEGWDRWDGPIYPVGYVQCRMRKFSPLFSPSRRVNEE
jgi:hypothetical protein